MQFHGKPTFQCFYLFFIYNIYIADAGTRSVHQVYARTILGPTISKRLAEGKQQHENVFANASDLSLSPAFANDVAVLAWRYRYAHVK